MQINEAKSFNNQKTFHLLIQGGKRFFQVAYVFTILDAIHRKKNVDLTITGDQSGAEKISCQWAKVRGVPLIIIPINWKGDGRAAAYTRNNRVLGLIRIDGIVVFPGQKDSDTMVKHAKLREIPVYDLRE